MPSNSEKLALLTVEVEALRDELDLKNELIMSYEGLMHSLLGALITEKPKHVEQAKNEMREALLNRAS